MARVVLAMSGGVDSSVAAWLLREQGHDVIGVFMRHGQDQPPSPPAPLPKAVGGDSRRRPCDETPGIRRQESPPTIDLPAQTLRPKSEGSCEKQGCCTAADAADARRVADMLGIPFYAINFQQEFTRIVDYFVAEYSIGRTPNPCIVCNTWLKFGRLFDYADQLGADYVATGHYARLVRLPDGETALCRGRDESKDQSYVLFGIERPRLPRLMFPVGDFCKDEIRRIAQRLSLRVAAKRDSQEICFVPNQDHAGFVRRHRGPAFDTSGEFVTTDGAVVGHHDGFERFTVGQRKGLGVAFGSPRYVVRIEAASRRVVIGTYEELARTELVARGANWLLAEGGRGKEEGGREKSESGGRADATDLPSPFGRGAGGEGGAELPDPSALTLALSQRERGTDTPPLPPSAFRLPPSSFRAQVKIRYRSQAADATVELLPEGRFHVRFDAPRHGIAPGQAAVCYYGERVLGGGWVE